MLSFNLKIAINIKNLIQVFPTYNSAQNIFIGLFILHLISMHYQYKIFFT